MWKGKIANLIYFTIIFIGLWIIKYLIMTPKIVTGIPLNKVNEIVNLLLIVAVIGVATTLYEYLHQKTNLEK